MLHRSFSLALILVGILLIAVLVLFRINLFQAAQSGPRWRRRLVKLTLAALPMLPIASCSLLDKIVNKYAPPTCYAVGPSAKATLPQDELNGMSDRLVILDKLIETQKLESKVAGTLLETFHARVDAIEAGEQMNETQQAQIRTIRDQLKKVQTRIG